MTTTPDADAGLVRAFPTPGPLLGTAYRDLYLAAEGSDNQKATIGDPNLLPKPWDPPTCRNPQLRAELWTWLDAVVIWVNHEYVWDPDGTIPPCWPLHPHIVQEVAVMADQRRRASVALDSNALEEWHRYTLPGFLERLRASRSTAIKTTNPGPRGAVTSATPATGTPSDGARPSMATSNT